MTEYNIRLNPNCAAAVHTGLKFKAGDKGITFRIAVDEMDTTGSTAKIVFLRANGTSVESDISGTDGVYTYKTLGNEFAVPGKTVADVKFYAADERVSTASFVFEVSGDTMDGLGAGAGGYSDRLEQLVTEAENTSEKLENLLILYQNKFGEVGVLNPKGTYNSATIYEAFDLVYYGGVSWLCLQRCTGVTPAEGAYWQLFASADGGNAARLGGKGASEYLTTSGGRIDGEGSHPFAIRGSQTPIYLDFENATDELVGAIGFSNVDIPVFVPHTYDAVYRLIHTGNVDDYSLPRSGGNIDGNITILSNNAVDRNFIMKNSEREILSRVSDGGGYILHDITNAKRIIESSADGTNTFNGTATGNLPTNGGVIGDGTDHYPLVIKGNASKKAWIGFRDATNTNLGFLGVTSDNNPVFIKNDLVTSYALLHTGNKPTGTYTGNGSATTRIIETGGIGGMLFVETGMNFALVTNSGAIVKDGTTITALDRSEANFIFGVLTLNTDNIILNGNGITCYYEVK